MEIRNIATFIKVAELDSFSKAAEELGYAQSTVTTQIKQLEEELQTELFIRNGKKVSVSSAGKQFLEHAYRLIRYEKEAKELFLHKKDPEGELRIGIMESICSSNYMSKVYKFMDRYKQISIKLYVCTTYDAMERLEKGTLDVILTLDQTIIRKHWLTYKEYRENISFFCSNNHFLARRESVQLQEMLQQPFILIEEGCNYRQVFEHDLKEMGQMVNCRMEIGHTKVIIDAVSANLGISLLPDFTIEEALREKRIVKIPLKDYGITMKMQLIYDKNRWASPALTAFLKDISSY